MDADHTMKQEMGLKTQKAASSHQGNIKQVIAVASNKGGVGKSYVCSLLAIEMARIGNQVGILDANLSGSSIPAFFGLKGPLQTGQYSFLPLQTTSGIKVISANLLVDDEAKTIIWKEALASKVIEELFREVEWGPLDYLLIDLPSATSEVAVSILQSIPCTGVVIVTQPQELCTNLVAKAIRTIRDIGINILGIVENMSYFLDTETNQKNYLFGDSHVDALSVDGYLPILTHLPFISDNNALCDRGRVEDIYLSESLELFDALTESISKLDMEDEVPQPNEEVDTAPVEIEEKIQEVTSDFNQEMTHTGQYFSNIVINLIRKRDNVGCLDRPDAQGHFLGKCGDRMQIDLQIVDKRILDARFLADGCGATLACGSMITKMACSKTLEEAGRIKPDELINALGGLPDDHLHCAELAVMTLREAIIDAVEGHKIRTK